MEEIQGNSGNVLSPFLQLVAWEITRRCNLFCAHCRASANNSCYTDELSTEECFHLVDQILAVGKPILILTGGEPLMRPDFLQISAYAVSKGIKVVMGSNGILISEEIARKMKEIPISRVAVSLDFPIPELQDKFRGQAGAFDSAIRGITNARQAGIEIQINSTLTQLNAGYLNELLELALKMGAKAFHPFFLVPTGRGKGLESVELSPRQYEDTLNWIYDKQVELKDKLFFKPTDAPHYLRVMKQREPIGCCSTISSSHASSPGRHHPANAITRGCLAGTGFCFISHRGQVQGCGYLDVKVGNIRERPFSQIWNDSPVFKSLRDISNIKGKCGVCEYKRICGGCRARAYEFKGDYLETEPYCVHQPVKQKKR